MSYMKSRSQPSPAAALLRTARMNSDLSQAQLAERAGVTTSVISAYETDRRQPTLNTLLRLLRSAGWDLRMRLQPAEDDDQALAGTASRFSSSDLEAERARQDARLAEAQVRDDAFERSRRAVRAARTRKERAAAG